MKIVTWNPDQDFSGLKPDTIVWTIELTSYTGVMLCDCAWTSNEEVAHHWITHPEKGETSKVVSMSFQEYLTLEDRYLRGYLKGVNDFEAAARLKFLKKWADRCKQLAKA